MKLQLNGRAEAYTAEQSLLALFPSERLSYAAADEDPRRGDCWGILTLEDAPDGASCRAQVELGRGGQRGESVHTAPLHGSAYEQEGQRRRCLSMGIFLAARDLTGVTPPWGSLSGIRPGKMAARFLKAGQTPEEAARSLETQYYVSPPRARLATEAAVHAERAAAGLDKGDIALYVGIPFCPTRCAYCSFVSASVEKTFALVPPYLTALEAELRAAGRMVRELGLRVRAFYMGGGTPTTLTAPQMDRLLGILEEAFDLSACEERTVEAGRPDTITAEKLAVLRRRAVSRISINPQTMEDPVLRAIGRRHSAADITAAMELVSAAGFAHVNMDLIAGLPEDTPEGFRRSLERCIAFGADNLTVHTLSLKKGSRILTEGLRIPDADAVGEMLTYADPVLRAAGYAPYYLYRQKYMSGSFENVGWCLPGAENLYNIDIMEELCSILSCGAGGSTKMVDPSGSRIARAFNAKYPKEYTERPEKWQSNQAEFSAFCRSMKGDL